MKSIFSTMKYKWFSRSITGLIFLLSISAVIVLTSCDENAEPHKKEILALKKQKQKNQLKLQVVKKLGNIPSKEELDRLLRYEGTIERQLYKAMNQLERLQRLRAGDSVPPPVEVDVDVNTGQNT